jgi:cell pole-organizing protein PopZ
MNKPAAKEPSMDEILSSIRQIIADDDESSAPRRPSLQVAPDPMEAASIIPASFGSGDDDEGEPLELSSAQIVPKSEVAADMGFEALLADAQNETAAEAPALVVPDDVSFSPAETETAELPSFDPAPEAFAAEAEYSPEPEVETAPVLSSFSRDEDAVVADVSEEPSFARSSVAEASPMPDANLSADIADGLLETTTKAAVRGSIGKLAAAGIGVVASPSLGNGNVTIEAMVREMLRPILKEWLDENLPSVVERMVEKEIARVARGE